MRAETPIVGQYIVGPIRIRSMLLIFVTSGGNLSHMI
jgi:hypothetical protein